MPVSLPPLTRRRFLAGALAAGTASLFGRQAFGADKEVDPHRFFLLSDTHISQLRTQAERGTIMFENMQRTCAALLAEQTAAAGVIINGDCAYHAGEAGDYAALLELLAPVRKSGMPVHLGMGNHDQRERFWKAFEMEKGAVEGRHVSVIKAERANIFLLDSLDVTNSTPGNVGPLQLAWLTAALDAAADKPAIIMVHHNPDDRPQPKGLTDSKAVMDALLPRKQVKLLFYGHTHFWEARRTADLHCVNLPPVAYVFKAGMPNGWIDLKLGEKGATLQLRCLDEKHAQHMQKLELPWRA